MSNDFASSEQDDVHVGTGVLHDTVAPLCFVCWSVFIAESSTLHCQHRVGVISGDQKPKL